MSLDTPVLQPIDALKELVNIIDLELHPGSALEAARRSIKFHEQNKGEPQVGINLLFKTLFSLYGIEEKFASNVLKNANIYTAGPGGPIKYGSGARPDHLGMPECLREKPKVFGDNSNSFTVVPKPRGETELVEQQEGLDCFVACAAMAEGTTYEDIAARLGKEKMDVIKELGTYGRLLDSCLDTLGWVRDVDYRAARGFTGHYSFQTLYWLFERPAILQVESINFENESHLVYWDGKKILDPSKLKKYTTEDLSKGCQNAWLFRPNFRD